MTFVFHQYCWSLLDLGWFHTWSLGGAQVACCCCATTHNFNSYVHYNNPSTSDGNTAKVMNKEHATATYNILRDWSHTTTPLTSCCNTQLWNVYIYIYVVFMVYQSMYCEECRISPVVDLQFHSFGAHGKHTSYFHALTVHSLHVCIAVSTTTHRASHIAHEGR